MVCVSYFYRTMNFMQTISQLVSDTRQARFLFNALRLYASCVAMETTLYTLTQTAIYIV